MNLLVDRWVLRCVIGCMRLFLWMAYLIDVRWLVLCVMACLFVHVWMCCSIVDCWDYVLFYVCAWMKLLFDRMKWLFHKCSKATQMQCLLAWHGCLANARMQNKKKCILLGPALDSAAYKNTRAQGWTAENLFSALLRALEDLSQCFESCFGPPLACQTRDSEGLRGSLEEPYKGFIKS